MCLYIICCMYCSTKNFYLIRQIIDPLMLYILGYMCQNENIDASAINTEKWKGTKHRAASQKSSKMVIKIPSTSNQMKVSSCFFFLQNFQILWFNVHTGACTTIHELVINRMFLWVCIKNLVKWKLFLKRCQAEFCNDLIVERFIILLVCRPFCF